MERQTLNRVLIGAGLALALAGGGVYWWNNRTPAPEAAPVEEPAPPPLAADVEDPIEHPLPDTAADGAPPLPALPESDPPLSMELGQLFGTSAVAEYLEPQNIARRIVATVDGLPRAHGADRLRPIKPVSPTFAVDRHPPTSPTAEERIFIADSNAARYTPLVSLLEMTDVNSIYGLYQRWYPLMQQSYEDLGYPGKYFNDRLVSVIDHLLETPTVKGPIELTQPNVMFEFADPQLEALSSGQKLLLRMGTDNANRVKAKLRELRKAVTAGAAAQAAADAGAAAGSAPQAPPK